MPAEPFAAQAKHFVEVRLLHRDVCVRLHTVDRNDSFFGSIEHPAGDIRQVLLTNGLAKCSDWSIRFLQLKGASALRSTEKSKNKRLNVYENHMFHLLFMVIKNLLVQSVNVLVQIHLSF